jgi:phosphatidylcholine synthase
MRLQDRLPMTSIRAYAVHFYTAAGIIFAFLAAMELCAPAPDPRLVLGWLGIALLIDSTDGPLARKWDVKTKASRISGRTMDDIIDYQTFTFIPLLLVWRMGWVPAPAGLWVAPALVVSLLGFSNIGAKAETEGFFLGFPSYWNIYAYYAGLFFVMWGPMVAGVMLIVLATFTILPVRFIYPNLISGPWRRPILWGAAVWILLLILMLPFYPNIPAWIVWLSLFYPAFYVVISMFLDMKLRRRRV